MAPVLMFNLRTPHGRPDGLDGIAGIGRSGSSRSRSHQGYLVVALLIATFFHLSVIAVYVLSGLQITKAGVALNRDVTIDLRRQPTSATLPVPATPDRGIRTSVTDPAAIPDAVPEESIVDDRHLPTQTELSEADGPAGTVDGTAGRASDAGAEGGLYDGAIGTEEDPSPFTVVENPPVPLRQVTPEYPVAARMAGLEGNVYMSLLVDREGKVKKVKIVKSDNEVFDENSILAAMQWIFRPAESGTGPVAVWVSVPFRFRITR